ncbi:hypothetical protein NL676_012797 [Syzygium grande]|nr:hypothetical protein NL676_012797 [Syzygium grande]
MTRGEQGGKKVIGSKGRSSEMNEHQGSKTLLPEAIPDLENNAIIDNDHSAPVWVHQKFRINSTCTQESDQQGYSSDKTVSRELHFQPGVDTNLSTIPELPRKALAIVKSSNTLDEKQSIREQMVGEATYSRGNVPSEGLTSSQVPGTEGEADKGNKPFLDAWNATKADKEAAKPDANLNPSKVCVTVKWLLSG